MNVELARINGSHGKHDSVTGLSFDNERLDAWMRLSNVETIGSHLGGGGVSSGKNVPYCEIEARKH
jgi:hypothetical protein